MTGRRTAELEVTFAAPVAVGIIDLQEPIEYGQSVAKYRVEGKTEQGWEVLVRGTTIGYRRLVRVLTSKIERLSIVIEDTNGPISQIRVGCFANWTD